MVYKKFFLSFLQYVEPLVLAYWGDSRYLLGLGFGLGKRRDAPQKRPHSPPVARWPPARRPPEAELINDTRNERTARAIIIIIIIYCLYVFDYCSTSTS